MLYPGLYEQVIGRELRHKLDELPKQHQLTQAIDEAEAATVLAQYVTDVVKKGLNQVADSGGGLAGQIALINRVVADISEEIGESQLSSFTVDEPGRQLLALLAADHPALLAGKTADLIARPVTSIAKSSLFTGAVHEPQLYSELKKEIQSADEINLLVSFIKWSGLRLIIDELSDFTRRGGSLRVITTSYLGATDLKAIDELADLPNTEIKVSYDTKRTRLHAKTYVFHRYSGFTTAYVGSSNLSNAAMSSGLEWNVKVTAQDLPDTIAKIAATFESYWSAPEFEAYSREERDRLHSALRRERFPAEPTDRRFVFDIRPYPYQQQILDRLEAERQVRGRYRNLVVAATGTGKTVVSAFDYRRFRSQDANRTSPGRLLYVAHREEILKQSRAVFQGVLKDPNFGDLWVGNHRPSAIDHLFASIQTIHSQALYDRLPADHFDYIVVDEFHHAVAPTYEKMLAYFRPTILLGLTATPERMDGKSILDYFDQRIAAEIRLPEAIDRKLLCPFQYFGVTDTVDLNELRWARGGYDRQDLDKVYHLDALVAGKRADHIVRSVHKYVTAMDDVKGLGFCVSVAHAHFMAEHFTAAGIPSLSLTGETLAAERSNAQRRLVSGEIRFLFVVDIYNEGVDIPEVNTVLFLRPTESLTVFLQQLGRGLRLADNKECLTVLDFIGQANRRYNFEEKFAALLANTRRSVRHELANSFVSAPKGCYIQLEKKAAAYVLDNIKASFSTKPGLISRLESFTADTGKELNLNYFLNHYRLEPHAIHARYSFARLCVEAGVRDDFAEPLEQRLTKSFPRLGAADSHRWIEFISNVLPCLASTRFAHLPELEQLMMQMFYISVWQKTAESWDNAEVRNNIASLAASPVMLDELRQLLAYGDDRIDVISKPVDLGFPCPLDIHCSYTRDQLFVALGYLAPGNIREGVKWLPDKDCDVLLVTLNKSAQDYSPTTMYNDYSISETLFHWQSQSTTSDSSPTGQRYINHRRLGSRVLLFVREFKTTSSGAAAPYSFLGPVEYVQHHGSRPMNIIWRLQHPIPAKYLKKTNKLVVG